MMSEFQDFPHGKLRTSVKPDGLEFRYEWQHLFNHALHRGMTLAEGMQWWRPGEKVWKGELPKSHLVFKPVSEIFCAADLFFNEQAYMVDIPEDHGWDKNLTNFEWLVKYVWLTYEFIQGGYKFKYPLCCHYNPQENVNVIHPGGTRNLILDLFTDENYSVSVRYFNTCGFYQDWMKNLEPMSLKEIKQELWKTVMVADHATLIPHLLHTTVSTIPVNKKKWLKKISDRLLNDKLRLKTNHDIKHLMPWTTEDNHTVQVNFIDDDPTDQDIARALLTVLAGIDFKSSTLEVVHI